ncbi:MAG: hypothetical protein AABX10_02150 [Nanoarchaeota archaeon]
MTERKPVVFGIGGLLGKEERGKIDDMLSIMAETYGCKTYAIRPAEVVIDGTNYLFTLSPEDRKEIVEAVSAARENPEADTSRVAIITSSIGALKLFEYLGESEDLALGLKAIAQNVPFTRRNEGLTSRGREAIERGEPFNFSSRYDRMRRVNRSVRTTSLPYLLDFDARENLKRLSPQYRFQTFTLLAKRDSVVDNQVTVECHRMLNGTDENMLTVEYDHWIPYEVSRKPIVDFLVKTLELRLA